MEKYVVGITACLLLLVMGSLPAAADTASSTDSNRPQGRPPMGPPPEAIAACKGKSEGTSVQFTTPRGDTLTGVCKLINSTLAAVPEGGMRGPQGKPPDNAGNTSSK